MIENITTTPTTQEVKENENIFQSERKKLLTVIDDFKRHINCKASAAKIISILKDNNCDLRCTQELMRKNGDKIDPFYIGRHDWVRKKIIDAIIDKFGDLLAIRSEHTVNTGKLDIAILPDIIQLKYGRQVIGIEIKSGSGVESKLFNQIERYLWEIESLIIVRVPSEDVVRIYRSKEDILIKDVKRLSRKMSRMISDKLVIVPGEYCHGCVADCQFKKPSRWESTMHHGSFKVFEDDIKHIDIVIEKILAVLELELNPI